MDTPSVGDCKAQCEAGVTRDDGDDSGCGFPLSVVLQHLRELAADVVPVLLVMTGALAPIHVGHVQCMRLAKAFVEEHVVPNGKVVAAFVSPSHDDYLEGKMAHKRLTHIPAKQRLAMTRLALQQHAELHSWLHASGWEAQQSTFVDFGPVTMAHRDIVAQACDSSPDLAALSSQLRVYFVSGSDHSVRCYLHTRNSWRYGNGIVCITRPGHEDDELRAQQQRQRLGRAFHFVDVPAADVPISSTRVREHLMRYPHDAGNQGAQDRRQALLQALKGMVEAAVVHYICDNGVQVRRLT